MRCEDCRDVISARLDGEDLPGDADAVDAHLRTCGACGRFASRAARVTRVARVRLVEPEPDLVERLLSAARCPAADAPAEAPARRAYDEGVASSARRGAA